MAIEASWPASWLATLPSLRMLTDCLWMLTEGCTVYKQNFMVDYENNSESVFEIQHLTGQVPFSGNAMNQWFAPQPENGYFFDTPVQDFVDEFETANVDTVVDTVWDEID